MLWRTHRRLVVCSTIALSICGCYSSVSLSGLTGEGEIEPTQTQINASPASDGGNTTVDPRIALSIDGSTSTPDGGANPGTFCSDRSGTTAFCADFESVDPFAGF